MSMYVHESSGIREGSQTPQELQLEALVLIHVAAES